MSASELSGQLTRAACPDLIVQGILLVIMSDIHYITGKIIRVYEDNPVNGSFGHVAYLSLHLTP